MITLLLTAALLSDATIVQTVELKANPGLPAPPAQAGALEAFREPMETTLSIQGPRLRGAMRGVETLLDTSTGEFQLLDVAGRRYAAGPLSEWQAAVTAAKSVAADKGGDWSWLQPVVQRRELDRPAETVAGHECRWQRIEVRWKAAGEAPNPGLARAITSMFTVVDWCISAAPAEFRPHLEAANQMTSMMMVPPPQSGGAAGMGAKMNEPLHQLTNELSNNLQWPWRMSMRMYMDVKAMLPPGMEVPAKLAPLVDAPMMTITADTKSYTVAPVAAERFTVPAGFTKVERETLDLMALLTSVRN